MKHSHLLLLWYIPVMFLFSYCVTSTETRNQLRIANAELREMRKQRDEARAKVQSLYEEFEQMQNQYLDEIHHLEVENKDLLEFKRRYDLLASTCDEWELRYSELKEWADDLVSGYGPGIWLPSRHGWPLYDRTPGQPTPRGVVEELNASFQKADNPLLTYKQTEEGVAYLGLENAIKLTTMMGSFGAHAYMQSVIFSLTSLEEIDCVDFDFEEGDHAAPGKFCR